MQHIQEFFFDPQHAQNRDMLEKNAGTRNAACILLPEQAPCATLASQLGTGVFDDLEFFNPYREGGTSVFEALDRTQTCGGREYLRRLLAHPIVCANTLAARQATLRRLEPHTLDIGLHVRKLAGREDDLLWLFEHPDENLVALYDMVYFKCWGIRRLNKVGVAVAAKNMYRILLSPVIGIISPIAYFIVPYLVLRYRMGFAMPFNTYLRLVWESLRILAESRGISGGLRICSILFSVVMYFQGVFNTIEMSSTLFKVAGCIKSRMDGIVDFMREAEVLVGSEYWDDDIPTTFWNAPPETPCPSKVDSPEGGVAATAAPAPFPATATHAFFGERLALFKRLVESKPVIMQIVNKTYMMDALHSVLALCAPASPYKYCYAELGAASYTNAKSTLHLSKCWHPSINNAVQNSIRMGDKDNVVLTGPNAGGKSTLVKGVLVSVLLAQTLSIAPAQRCVITPFKYINSQINIPDCKGKESLFQAEMNRCKVNFDALAGLAPEDHALIVMDEVFNSTNPVEGISGAYAVAKHLTKRRNTVVVLTTHFSYLTRLAKDTSVFTNYRMNVDKDPVGGITFPYSLERGVSRQYIAIDLLEQSLDKSVIDTAKHIRDELCRV